MLSQVQTCQRKFLEFIVADINNLKLLSQKKSSPSKNHAECALYSLGMLLIFK